MIVARSCSHGPGHIVLGAVQTQNKMLVPALKNLKSKQLQTGSKRNTTYFESYGPNSFLMYLHQYQSITLRVNLSLSFPFRKSDKNGVMADEAELKPSVYNSYCIFVQDPGLGKQGKGITFSPQIQ